MATLNRSTHAVVIYTRYERFWHWTQAALIFFLAFTGFNVHGTFDVLPFGLAVKLHTYAAIALITLWIFTTFWNFTTGNWKQFLPFFQIRETDGQRSSRIAVFFKRLFAVIRYYAYGILRNEEHPHKKTLRRKQNALQGLSYLFFMIIIGPALWLTGIVYLLFDVWNGGPNSGVLFQIVAFIHTAAAFLIIAFAIIHVYMTTTGHTVFHYIKGMITGVEEIELTDIEKAYLETEHPERMG
ncbi:MAG: cytochrome B [Hyphomicrobiales bacterium]|nr:MAG: cytochrome B [Hyphomicrobiales bacterium]